MLSLEHLGKNPASLLKFRSFSVLDDLAVCYEFGCVVMILGSLVLATVERWPLLRETELGSPAGWGSPSAVVSEDLSRS